MGRNVEYNSGDIICFDGSREYIGGDMSDTSFAMSPCNNNKQPKSYSSAVTASSECKNKTDITSTRGSNIDVRGAKCDDERIEDDIQYNIRKEDNEFESPEEFKVTTIVRKTGLSTSTSPISSRSSSFTWYEEDDDCTEGTFNYTTILNFIKSEWESIAAEISTGSKNEHPKVVYYKTWRNFLCIKTLELIKI